MRYTNLCAYVRTVVTITPQLSLDEKRPAFSYLCGDNEWVALEKPPSPIVFKTASFAFMTAEDEAL